MGELGYQQDRHVGFGQDVLPDLVVDRRLLELEDQHLAKTNLALLGVAVVFPDQEEQGYLEGDVVVPLFLAASPPRISTFTLFSMVVAVP